MSTGGLRRSQKPTHRVQFLGENVSPGSPSPPVDHQDIPRIQVQDGIDPTHTSLPSPDYTLRTNTAAVYAQDRARKLQSRLSTPGPSSTRSYNDDYFGEQETSASAAQLYESPPLKPLADHPVRLDDIPLVSLNASTFRRPYDLHDDTSDDDSGHEEEMALRPIVANDREHVQEAKRLVRSLTNGMGLLQPRYQAPRSGTATPAIDQQLPSHELEYVPAPDQYKPSVLSSILFSKLAQHQQSQSGSIRSQSHHGSVSSYVPKPEPATVKESTSRKQSIQDGQLSPPEDRSGPSSGRITPNYRKPKWYDNKSPRSPRDSISSTATLVGGHSGSRTPLMSSRPSYVRARSTGMIATAVERIKRPISSNRSSRANSLNDHIIELETQVSDILARRKYIHKLCRALMIFGAPTHRMEEYMCTTARKLMVQGSFQYLPNCMIMAFDDPDTHTTEVHLVKESAAIDLGKFKDTFNVYKNVIHEVYTAAEAVDELQAIINRTKKYPKWLLVLVYGIAAVGVGPFAFSARPIDFPICFLLGSILGCLQLYVAPNSTQFSHVFEVFASLIISFAARGFGSITMNGQPLFCFSAIAQSSIALILPGWFILCAAQELQSRNLVAGSIRMVYAIIYTLFLGFGILLGTTLVGLVYPSATNVITCDTPWWWDGTEPRWRSVYVNFAFVPIFTTCLAMINQARWKQMISMNIISLAGYTTNYFAGLRFAQNIQVANACGAFVVGALANLYSRWFHGLAAAAMLPAIFVQVPSGLAASGSLVAGLTSANQITKNASGVSVIVNGTQGFLDAQNSTSATGGGSDSLYGGTIFNVGYGMVQVAIGISVGLFLSSLFIYPFGKKRSGLFSF